jgi:hypothetical protein
MRRGRPPGHRSVAGMGAVQLKVVLGAVVVRQRAADLPRRRLPTSTPQRRRVESRRLCCCIPIISMALHGPAERDAPSGDWGADESADPDTERESHGAPRRGDLPRCPGGLLGRGPAHGVRNKYPTVAQSARARFECARVRVVRQLSGLGTRRRRWGVSKHKRCGRGR